MPSNRDFNTEALAVAAHYLGWPSTSIEVVRPEGVQGNLRFLKSPKFSRFGVFVNLASAYHPEFLLVPLEESEAKPQACLAAFISGLRTSDKKINEIREVNRGMTKGPVQLETAV